MSVVSQEWADQAGGPPLFCLDVDALNRHNPSHAQRSHSSAVHCEVVAGERSLDPSKRSQKRRTLTNVYNERPTWLQLAHERLDRAVLAAYTAMDPAGEWSEDWAAVWVESGAGQPLPAGEDEFGTVAGTVSVTRHSLSGLRGWAY